MKSTKRSSNPTTKSKKSSKDITNSIFSSKSKIHPYQQKTAKTGKKGQNGQNGSPDAVLDSLKHYRGASMGPGAYDIDRSILKKKPINQSEELGIAFSSSLHRFGDTNPQIDAVTGKFIPGPKDFKGPQLYIGDQKNRRKSPAGFLRGVGVLNKRSSSQQTFGKLDRFQSVQEEAPDKKYFPGPGAYDPRLSVDPSGSREKGSIFFRSKSKRILDQDRPPMMTVGMKIDSVLQEVKERKDRQVFDQKFSSNLRNHTFDTEAGGVDQSGLYLAASQNQKNSSM